MIQFTSIIAPGDQSFYMAESIFYNLLYFWLTLSVVVFFVNLKITAPYGRHANRNWGVLVNNRMAWLLMELPVIFLVTFLFFRGGADKNWYSWILYLAFATHYVHRTCIYPFRMKRSKKDMPLSIMLMAIVFNMANGFFIGYALGNFQSILSESQQILAIIVGGVIFVGGMYINWKSDTILINLRADGSTGYRIPNGFLFNAISCPNHFGEMIEWTGYAIMSFNLPALSFALWTAANLIPRALAHHRWYKQHFEDYPKERKAFLPGVI